MSNVELTFLIMLEQTTFYLNCTAMKLKH